MLVEDGVTVRVGYQVDGDTKKPESQTKKNKNNHELHKNRKIKKAEQKKESKAPPRIQL
jgi:hypothetical protein